jgi:hypothetical protein
MNGFELYEKVKEIDDTAKACFITAHELLWIKEIYSQVLMWIVLWESQLKMKIC